VIAFLVDQNFTEHIVDGLTRRDATLAFTHARDAGLAATAFVRKCLPTDTVNKRFFR
jgi:hypothetical protein